jgi:hypothetical protein
MEADLQKWGRLGYRQRIWKFMQKEIKGRWHRNGNKFFFESDRDAVIFALRWA